MEVVVRQSRGFTCAYFVLACSIAVLCAGAATGGQHGGGHGSGGSGGGGHGAGGQNGGSHKGTSNNPGGSGSPADDETSTTGTPTAPGAATATAVASARGGQSLDLPAALQPPSDSNTQLTVSRTEAVPGVPDEVIRACHDAIESAAAPFGATRVRVSSAGLVRQLSRDTISAPVEVSIDYVRQGSVETRQAPIKCELNATGSVIGLT
ncbi:MULTISPECIES: hypothetical protein [Mesorhizobium]|uniref:hypothetical protein n=1 Tax=Mesorhizobium TaxID=68287 RepID=UPI0018DBDA0C|nr:MULTISPECIES: hypothetical protein [Mesorhizobium]WJI36727.1 hypothetical protein NL534_22950 [Mesorhizobium opportunistum]